MKTKREKKLELALKRIEKWFGEFPYPNYGVDWGSCGERDFMRQIAREALLEEKEDKPKKVFLKDWPFKTWTQGYVLGLINGAMITSVVCCILWIIK
jgi:hypothetical protein